MSQAIQSSARLRQARMTPAAAFERFGFYAALLILIAVFSALSPAFLTLQNGINILQQTSTIGIMAIGETLVILAGGIDVSVGSILGLGGMISAIVLRDAGADPVTAMVLGTLSGLVVGLLQWSADHLAWDRPVHHHAGDAQRDPRRGLHRFEPV